LVGLLRDEIEDVAKKAFQSYLGVVGSPPVGFEDFTVKVNKYMQLPPFNFPNPVSRLGGMKRVLIFLLYFNSFVSLLTSEMYNI